MMSIIILHSIDLYILLHQYGYKTKIFHLADAEDLPVSTRKVIQTAIPLPDICENRDG